MTRERGDPRYGISTVDYLLKTVQVFPRLVQSSIFLTNHPANWLIGVTWIIVTQLTTTVSWQMRK